MARKTMNSRPVKVPYFLFQKAKEKQKELIVERQEFVPLWEGLINLDDREKKKRNKYGGFNL